ncbi:MAG: methylmalonyl-CoA mutase, partial [Acidimicrobiia bacterium]
ASGARLACICSSDAVYAREATGAVEALRAAGAARIYLAGAPGAATAAVDEYICAGCDVPEVLTRALDELGVNP